MKINRQKYYDVTALKDRWGIHPESVRRIIRSGHLPAIRFGGRLRIDLEDVKVFEQSHRVTNRSNTEQYLGLAIKTKQSGNERLLPNNPQTN